MGRCIFCNKFSFFLNEGVCKNCIVYYEKEANRILQESISKNFEIVDDFSLPIEKRKDAIEKVKKNYNSFLYSNAGKACKLFDPKTVENLDYDIKKAEREIEEIYIAILKKRENTIALKNRIKNESQIYPSDAYSFRSIKVNTYDYSSKIGFKQKYSKIAGNPNNYVVFDLETTGLDNTDDEIIEIGAIKYINNQENERFHSYINPHRSIPRAASQINHITQAKVKHSPDLFVVLSDFLVFIGDLPLMAYNSDFDMGFLQTACHRHFDFDIENNVIDALPLAREYLSELSDKKLETVKKHFQLDVGSHNALDDCFVTNHLYQYCKEFLNLQYKYNIPFSYGSRELEEKELKYINAIVKICDKNNIDKSNLTMSSNSKMLSVYNGNEFIIGIKMYSKLNYIVLNISYNKFQRNFNTDIKSSASPKSEGDYTRLFPEDPEQLELIIKRILKK